ncbi:hypothetical protein BY458DRAFT_499561 [Sporodiniella umbellata]|nr:hypothetical protein BY458DRAFT_499561 [Sporodiniella umbellata]
MKSSLLFILLFVQVCFALSTEQTNPKLLRRKSNNAYAVLQKKSEPRKFYLFDSGFFLIPPPFLGCPYIGC